MDVTKSVVLLLLVAVGLTWKSAIPNDPKLPPNPEGEPRHDLDTGNPDASGGDYQPAALSGSGQTPAYTSYQFQ